MTAEATEDLPAMPAEGGDEPIGGRPEGRRSPVAHAEFLPADHRCLRKSDLTAAVVYSSNTDLDDCRGRRLFRPTNPSHSGRFRSRRG